MVQHISDIEQSPMNRTTRLRVACDAERVIVLRAARESVFVWVRTDSGVEEHRIADGSVDLASLAIADDGTVHVLVGTGGYSAGGPVVHHTLREGTWSQRDATGKLWADAHALPGMSDLAFDGEGRPAFLYTDDATFLARFDGTGWSRQQVHPDALPALAFAHQGGHDHVLAGHLGLWHGRQVDGAWAFTPLSTDMYRELAVFAGDHGLDLVGLNSGGNADRAVYHAFDGTHWESGKPILRKGNNGFGVQIARVGTAVHVVHRQHAKPTHKGDYEPAQLHASVLEGKKWEHTLLEASCGKCHGLGTRAGQLWVANGTTPRGGVDLRTL